MNSLSSLMHSLSLLPLFVVAAGASDNFVVVSQKSSNLASTVPALYGCTLTNKWTSDRHPNNYPEGKAKWVEPVLVSHTSEYSLFKVGEMASGGVKQMATVRTNDA